MRNARYLPILLLTLWACAPTRPTPAAVSDASDEGQSEYYVASHQERPGMSRLGQKRLLPDPHGGLGTTNDRTLRVTDIQLTSRYTVLYLTFGLDTQSSSYQPRSSSSISFDKGARLVTGSDPGSLKTFNFVKAEGIVLTPDSQTVDADQQVNFRLYFERLDKGVEDFNLFECEDTQTTTCWNVRGMHITNPADSTATPNRK